MEETKETQESLQRKREQALQRLRKLLIGNMPAL